MRRSGARAALALGVWMAGLIAGCAAPGDPTVRHPVVPVPVTDLAARQSGNEVVLSFSRPTRSTDREALAESPSIEIYRAALSPGTTPDRKTPWRLVYAIPSERLDTYARDGRIEIRDPLTADSVHHPSGSPLAYMVRTREVKSRASDDSNFVTERIYPPPDAPLDVRTDVTETAIRLTWNESALPSGSSTAGYRIYRVETGPAESPAPQGGSQSNVKSTSELLGPSPVASYEDSRFEFGKTYSYTVRAVAQFGDNLVESADSTPAVVTAVDIFPPAAPRGLEIAIVPATTQSTLYIELSWAISSEPDLAGYFVYRSDREDSAGQRLNKELLPSPTFRDISVAPGGRYYYRVSAVDRAGNESPNSSAVQALVP